MTNKNYDMKHILQVALAAGLVFVFSACGSGSKEKKSELTEKKTKLEKLKGEQKKLNDEVAQLENDIAKADPGTATSTAKLVTVLPVIEQDFKHYIELQGKIDAENISYVTPRGLPAQVKAIYVKKGDYVKKGQLIIKLDDAVQLKQLQQLKTQLAYAEDLLRRQKNLWDQGIGTEVQLKTAENNVKSLQDQINTTVASWEMSNVRSEVSGYVETMTLRKGETFTGFVGNNPQIVIVNKSDLKMTANIPENYITRVKQGSPVEIVVPDLNNRIINSKVSLISQSIDPNSRSFVVEAKISNDGALKPNQVATMKILDYTVKNAIVVPINTVQTDEKGKYVYVMEKKGDKIVAAKRMVLVGESYGDQAEIKPGSALKTGEQLITQGYQNLYEGQVIATATK
jgi:RND family efflux transporter MFP subunit